MNWISGTSAQIRHSGIGEDDGDAEHVHDTSGQVWISRHPDPHSDGSSTSSDTVRSPPRRAPVQVALGMLDPLKGRNSLFIEVYEHWVCRKMPYLGRGQCTFQKDKWLTPFWIPVIVFSLDRRIRADQTAHQTWSVSFRNNTVCFLLQMRSYNSSRIRSGPIAWRVSVDLLSTRVKSTLVLQKHLEARENNISFPPKPTFVN